jgi:class 3 adenylate cyclase/pimeloyl-ACP methyl ester carboxylesterase
LVEYVQHDGSFVAYDAQGEGPGHILYMPGALVSIDAMADEPHVARLNRRLASIGRLVQFDPPGLGLSDASTSEVTLERIAECGRAVLDAVNVDRADVIAANAGGLYAVVLAATAPERVRSLVLIDTQACALEDDDYPLGYPRAVVQQYVDSHSTPGIDWSIRSADGYALMNPSLRDDPAFRQWAEQSVRRCASPATALRFVRLVSFADVRRFLPAIHARTLVLAKRDNVFLPAGHGKYLAEHIDGAQFMEVPGADYAPFSGDVDALIDPIEEFLTGRRSTGRERVLTTLLFTDLVDSTGMVIALGDRAWHALLDNHDAVVRAEIRRYGGTEVNTTGDGFLATFDSPTQAVRAAQAIVGEAAKSNLAVRVGIHTGECERRGTDLAGLTVHIAARVAGCAGPAEVLVSRTVRDLLGASELRFADRGEYELQGIPTPWQLFALDQ